jgi:TRAP-type C4-dicarboxylate transport system permease small subunit
MNNMPTLLRRGLEYLCAGLLFVIVVIVFSNVIGRYFLHAPIRWSDEVSLFLFLWLAYLGALAALMAGRHYSFPALIDMFPAKLRLATKTLSDLMVLAMLGVLVWCGGLLVDLLHHQRSPAIDLPLYYVYAAMPVVSFLMALVVAYQIVARLRGAPELGQEAVEQPLNNPDPL